MTDRRTLLGAGLAAMSGLRAATSATDGTTDGASLATRQGMGGDAPAYRDPLGAGLIGYRGRTAIDKLDEWCSVRDYGARGDGVADDTVAIQHCLDDAQAKRRTVYLPDGIYLCGPLLFGANRITTRGNNPAPLGLIGQSNQGATLLARAGMDGRTLLQAWSMAATTFENFTLNGNGQRVRLADWDWKAEVGPSTLNVIRNVRAINCPGAAIAVSLNNLNDTAPEGLNVFTYGDGSKVGIQARQSGGQVRFSDCQSVGGYWDVNGQNILLDHCLDEGIQLTSGAQNVLTLIGGQSYGNVAKKAVIWTDLFGLNSGIKGLHILGRYLPITRGVTSVLDLSIYAGLVEIVNCAFDCQDTVALLSARTASSYGGPVRILVRGGSSITNRAGVRAIAFNDTNNPTGYVIALAQGVTDSATATLVDKHWAGDLSHVALVGNDPAVHPVRVQGAWRRSMDDTVTFSMRLRWTSLSNAGQPMAISGLPFADAAGPLRTIVRGHGTAGFADASFDLFGGHVLGFRGSDGAAFPVPATGDIAISGSYVVSA